MSPLRAQPAPSVSQSRPADTRPVLVYLPIVCEDLAQCEGGRVRVWPYTHGRPVVEDFLEDPTFAPVYRFTAYDLPFVLLGNRSQ